MKTIDLLAPLLDSGIRSTNFFNGRLLSAEDLSAEQDANRQHHELLGKAAGEGVAFGLEVSVTTDPSSPPDATRPLLKVTAGLALNRKGQTLSLPDDATIRLVPAEEEQASVAGLFAACKPPTTAVYQTGTGVYILAIAPASGYEGKAPMSGLGEEPGAGRACGKRYAIEGVQFRLVELKINTMTNVSQTTRDEIASLMTGTSQPGAQDQAKLSMLRNRLAHLCFGTEELANFPADPFERANGESPYTTYGAMDFLRSQKGLTDCDVPLSLIYWTTDGIQFLDMWSVRRRTIPRLLSETWPHLVSKQRLAEAGAMFLQFQDHIEQLLNPAALQSQLAVIKATDYFRYLPPVGILPIIASYIQEYQKGEGAKPISVYKPVRGLYPPKFFDGLTTRKPAFIEGARLELLLRTGGHFAPIDLTGKELIWLYLVRENVEAIGQQLLTPPQAYLLFASGQMPYMANARYDVAKWDYSNYAFV